MASRRRTGTALKTIAVAALALGLAACGGGGTGVVKPTPPPPPPPPPPPASYDPANNQLLPTGVQAAHKAGFIGKGVKVGIMGSGVDPTTPPLSGRIAWFKSYLPDGNPTPTDTSGHDTVVADILGGLPQGVVPLDGKTFGGGVAPGAGLYVEQVCSSNGAHACGWSTTNLDDFVGQGVRVINISAGKTDAAGTVLRFFTGPNDPAIASA